MSNLPTPPRLRLALSELPRAGAESLRLLSTLPRLVRQHSGADGHPVLVMPGYGAADGSTGVLRHFLGKIGYQPFAMGLGRNVEGLENRIQSVDDATDFRERMVELTVERIRSIYHQTGERVSLVGWSMGGLYALDASHQIPDMVRQVITLGSPFGDPRGTSLFMLLRKLSGSTVPLEAQDFQRWTAKASSAVPTRVIYSERDGIVSAGIARLPDSEHTEHVHVDSSHVAFAMNPKALDAVATGLAATAMA